MREHRRAPLRRRLGTRVGLPRYASKSALLMFALGSHVIDCGWSSQPSHFTWSSIRPLCLR